MKKLAFLAEVVCVVILVMARVNCQVRPIEPIRPPIGPPISPIRPPVDPVRPPVTVEPIRPRVDPVRPPTTVNPVRPPVRVDSVRPPVRVMPSAGGGSPPPRKSYSRPYALPSYDQEEKRLRELIRRYNGDEALREYLSTAKEVREKVDKAREVVFAITAVDPYHEIAELIVKRLEEKMIGNVYRQLAAQLARVQARVEGWGVTDNRYTTAQRESALADIRQYEQWLDNVTHDALVEANSRTNQGSDSASSNAVRATIVISSSPEAATSHVHWTEGTAIRQLRDVTKNGWARVLNERR